MRALFFIIIACTLYSCEKENNTSVIDSFPSVLTFDSWIIKNREAYSKDGKLTLYDERFDEFELKDFWIFDSLIVLNKLISVTYQDLNVPFAKRIDAFYNELHDSYFKTVPARIPESIEVIDTRSTGNERVINVAEDIELASTWTFRRNENTFLVSLTSVRVFSKTEGGYDLYRMIEQSCANSVDKESLYRNLEPGETLSLIDYELTFKIR